MVPGGTSAGWLVLGALLVLGSLVVHLLGRDVVLVMGGLVVHLLGRNMVLVLGEGGSPCGSTSGIGKGITKGVSLAPPPPPQC